MEAGWEVRTLGLVEEDREVGWEVRKLDLEEGDREGGSQEGATVEGAQVPSGVVGFQGASPAVASNHRGGTFSSHLVEVASRQDSAPSRVAVALEDPSQGGEEVLSGPIPLVAAVPILQAVVDFLNPTVHA